ncbi:hypothetical protein LWI29_023438 [Acer saccharum]|uniref:Glycine-rich protein n=1 Tax=Acer saccharum TaxID=4024 RepID=A0AA39W302_ACESA|nr:hypothetical protein LWI29_023438 [Acer saccharum]
MTCIQATGLCANLPTRPLSKHRPSPPFQIFFKPTKTHNQKLCASLKRTPLCLMGGKDRAEDEGAAWKSFGKAMEKFSKGQSIEDVLRQQVENKEYHVGGNGGKNPPRGRGGGGRDGSGGSSEDEGVMNETMQVILATIGFIFLYIYIIRGEELTRLGKDYIRYLYGGHKSIRLKNAMYSWERFWKQLGEKVMYDKNWLEKLIINTQTWYNSPDKYRLFLRSHMASKSDD